MWANVYILIEMKILLYTREYSRIFISVHATFNQNIKKWTNDEIDTTIQMQCESLIWTKLLSTSNSYQRRQPPSHTLNPIYVKSAVYFGHKLTTINKCVCSSTDLSCMPKQPKKNSQIQDFNFRSFLRFNTQMRIVCLMYYVENTKHRKYSQLGTRFMFRILRSTADVHFILFLYFLLLLHLHLLFS